MLSLSLPRALSLSDSYENRGGEMLKQEQEYIVALDKAYDESQLMFEEGRVVGITKHKLLAELLHVKPSHLSERLHMPGGITYKLGTARYKSGVPSGWSADSHATACRTTMAKIRNLQAAFYAAKAAVGNRLTPIAQPLWPFAAGY